MWRWQHKKLEDRSFLSRCLGISVGVHVLVLLFLFISGRRHQYIMTITSTSLNTDVPIVFLPLPSAQHMRDQQAKGGGTKSNAPTPAAHGTKRAKTVVTDKAVSIASAKKEKKKSKKAAVEKKKTKKVAVPQLKKVEKKKEEKVPEKTPEIVQPKPATAVSQAPAVASEVPQAGATENVLYVGYDELDALQREEYIRQEVAQLWAPPKGLPHDLQCVLKVVITAEGAVQEVVVEHSSGVPMFDTSARMAMLSFTPPSWAYGKELLITFKE